MSEIKTSFEIVEDLNDYKGFTHKIIQRKRTVYYEDVVNPLKYRDCVVCYTESLEIAEKLLQIFNQYPFTSEFMRTYTDKFHHSGNVVMVNNGPRTYNKYELYGKTNSKVEREEDLYNGTDQSVMFFQLMKDKNGKYSSKSTTKNICKFWDNNYIPVLLNVWSKATNQKFFEE